MFRLSWRRTGCRGLRGVVVDQDSLTGDAQDRAECDRADAVALASHAACWAPGRR
jgi:hypothetical protein